MNEPTRTDQGYANWKEYSKVVAAARVQANGRIAQKRIWGALVLSWAVPVVEWLNRHLGGIR